MKLFCIGDVAINLEILPDQQWMQPSSSIPGIDTKILFNWELPIGKSVNPTPRTRGPRLLSHPNSVDAIHKWAPGFAALATNHIMDAGEEGLAETISTLHKLGFQTFGAGQCDKEIKKPLLWETNEGRLAVINWVFPETHPDWLSIPGPNCWPGVEAAESLIRDLKSQSDWVIILVHWSDELFPYPRLEDRKIARELAKSGADLIIGHHPHVVRGMELIETCPVFYSIGNYFFSDFPELNGGWIVKQAPRNRESLGILVSFQRGCKLKYQVLSYWNEPAQTIPDPLQRAVHRMDQVSRPLKKIQYSTYNTWYQAKRFRFDKWEARWNFGIRRLGISGLTRNFINKLPNRL